MISSNDCRDDKSVNIVLVIIVVVVFVIVVLVSLLFYMTTVEMSDMNK